MSTTTTGTKNGCTTSINSQIVTSQAPSVTSRYSTIMPPPVAALPPNSFDGINQPDNGCGTLQFNAGGLMFRAANGVMTYPVVPPTVNNGAGNHHYTQLLPQVDPMNAVPISVAALSHGPPQMTQSQSAFNSYIGRNNIVNGQNSFGSFSSPPNAVSHQCGKQNEHRQIQGAYQTSFNMPSSTGTLPHPGQHLVMKKRRQHEAVKVPQDMLSSSRSIVSLSPFSDSISTRSPKISGPQGSTVQAKLSASSAQNNTQQITEHKDLPHSTKPTPKKERIENQPSMYSSACNATIKAQQKLNIKRDSQMKRNGTTHIKIENDENDTKEKTNGSLLGEGMTSSTVVHTNSIVTSPKVTHQTSIKRKLSFGKLFSNNVLLSIGSDGNHTVKHKYVPVVGGKDETNSESKTPIFPHAFLQKLLKRRGYSTKHYCSLEGGYYCRPTPLQCASYGTRVVHAVRNSDKNLFAALLAAGLSRNPCNKFGESILHMVCRRGDYDLLKLLIENGATVQVSDDFGRTPLHDACWTSKPCFKLIKILLEKDIRLLHIVDCRGSPPLEYVKRENWGEWNKFLDENKEVFWPPRSLDEDNEEPPPQLVNIPPHSKPVSDPENCVSVEQAALFANGKKEPLCAA